jgi:hypothetical protein
VWDVSDKANPVMITRITDPSFGYCHNIWPSENGRFFYTTEETANKTVKCWEMISANNIVRRGQYLAPCKLVHNVHVQDGLVWMSHYESGVTVVDFSDPDNPVQLAAYDTWPASDTSRFKGCWGVFPHSPNGEVYASNFDGLLFVFDWSATVAVPEPISPASVLQSGPNPFENQIKVWGTEADRNYQRVKVLDPTGRLLLFEENPLRKGSWEWNGTDESGQEMPAGTYFLYFEGEGGEAVIRVQKM